MNMSTLLLLSATLWFGGAEARLRMMPRQSPGPTPTPTGCQYPAASPAIPASTPCASGINSFALQIADCDNAANGQYVKAHVSDVDGAGRLWISETCIDSTCSGSQLTDDPTLYYIDADGSTFISPDSPLPPNATSLQGKRMEWDAADDILSPYVSQVNFATPGSAEEGPGELVPLTCTIGSDGSFNCLVSTITNPSDSPNPLSFGTQPYTMDGSNSYRGTEVMLGDVSDWSGVDEGGSPDYRPSVLKAIPACQAA